MFTGTSQTIRYHLLEAWQSLQRRIILAFSGVEIGVPDDISMAELVIALTTDSLVESHLAFPATTALLIGRVGPLAAKRVRHAAEILRKKIRLVSRRALADEGEELQSIIARYLRAAQEGAAKQNLELMADVIAGMAEQENVEADAFLRHSNILADLSGDEIRLLSSIMVVTQHDKIPRRLGRNAVDGGQPLIPAVYADNRKVIEGVMYFGEDQA